MRSRWGLQTLQRRRVFLCVSSQRSPSKAGSQLRLWIDVVFYARERSCDVCATISDSPRQREDHRFPVATITLGPKHASRGDVVPWQRTDVTRSQGNVAAAVLFF